MSKVLARYGRLSAYKLVLIQAIVATSVTILFFVSLGGQAGISALAGTFTAVLPNFVFATLAFSHSGANSADKVIKTFYWGEALKLLLTAALFSLVFTSLEVVIMPLFVSYFVALMVHWTAPLFFKQSKVG